MTKILFFLLVLSATSGCAYKLADFPLTSQNEVLGQRLLKSHPEAKEVSFNHCNHVVFFIPLKKVYTQQEVTDSLLAQAPQSNVLIEIVESSSFYFFPFIYAYTCLDIKAQAIKL